ncbi:MAG: PAS domain S-box protein [Leptolyngbya sp. DLM2.Bin15]|nr:MAG: PAS domain S-box protein [Leptolyngbya sp. DLM2.Bin15]
MCGLSSSSGQITLAIARDLPLLSTTTTLAKAIADIERFRTSHHATVTSSACCAFVMEQDTLVGLVSDRDIVAALAAGRIPAQTLVGEIMAPPPSPIPLAEVTHLPSILSHLQQANRCCLPVIDQGQIIGCLNTTHILQVLGPQLLSSPLPSQPILLGIPAPCSRLQNMIATSPAVMFTCRPEEDYKTTFVSANIQELLGYSPHTFVQEPNFWSDRLHPDDRDRFLSALALLPTQGVQHHEYRFLHHDGHYVWLGSSLRMVFDNQGKPVELVGYVIDITEQKHIEQRLRQQAAHLSAAQRIANLGSWEFDIHTGAITWSPQSFVVFGFDEADGEPTLEQLEARFKPEACLQHRHVLEQAIAQASCYELEIEFNRPNGSLGWVAARGEPIFDASGHLSHFVGTVLDITDRKLADLKRKCSEARYRAVVEDQMDLICRFLPDGRLTFANYAYCQYIQVDPEAAIGHSLEQLVPSEEYARLQQLLSHLTPATPTTTNEQKTFTASGEERWQLWTDRAMFDDQGQVIEYQSVGHDITDRKRIELALQQSETRYRAIVEDQTEMICRFRPDGSLSFANTAYRRYFNIDTTLPDKNAIWQYIPDDELDFVRTKVLGLTPEAPTVTYEHRVELPDGTTAWQLWTDRAIFDDQGQLLEYQSAGRDITDRKHDEQQLRQLSERLALALKSGAIGIWEWDLVQDHLVWDEQMYRLHGRSPDDPVQSGADWQQSLHPEDRQATETVLTQALQGEQEFDATFRIVWPDGSPRFIKAYGQVQRSPQGQPVRMVGINFDITKRQEAQQRIQVQNDQLSRANLELERATRLKDEFLASMSHELRTPLNAILGMSEGLQEDVFGALNPRQQKAIATIERSGQHLLELINDILDLSKIAADKLELQPSLVSVNTLCQASLAFVQESALRKHIHLEHDIRGVASLYADERRLRQILINLLVNAVKFTPEGGHVSLTVSTILSKQDQESSTSLQPEVVFSIRDTGIGIAESDRNKLFQPFVQIDSALNRQHAGTGLGLSLVKRLAELHGGHISVESSLGQGSCFSVHIPSIIGCPIPTVTAKENLSSAAVCPTAAVPIPNVPSVLIVEDADDVADQIKRYLTELGIPSTVCSHGENAIAQATQLMPSLIILDLLLPEISGWEILTQLKHNPVTAPIPVIIASVVDEQGQGLTLGAEDYLVKPITRVHLHAAIRRLQPSLLSDQGLSDRLSPTIITPNHHPDAVILVAEDNPANIETIADYLTLKGYHLIYAHNGYEAVNLAQVQTPDLILMDIQMPGLSGLDAIHRIRATVSPTLPIIAMTALAMPGDRDRCLLAGANDYLTKPIRLKLMLEAIQQLLPHPEWAALSTHPEL